MRFAWIAAEKIPDAEFVQFTIHIHMHFAFDREEILFDHAMLVGREMLTGLQGDNADVGSWTALKIFRPGGLRNGMNDRLLLF